MRVGALFLIFTIMKHKFIISFPLHKCDVIDPVIGGALIGGAAANIVAPSCEFVIDMRSLNVKKLEQLT